MKAIGKMISNTEKELNFGMTIQNTKENTKRGRRMGKGAIHGKMGHSTLETGLKTKSMGLEGTLGMTEESIREIGKTTIWMAMGSTLGKMEGGMRANIQKIRSMARVSIPGPTGASTMVNGKTGGSMELVSIFLKLGNLEKGSGKMEKEKNGLMKSTRTKLQIEEKNI